MSDIKYQTVIDLSIKNNSHTLMFDYVTKIAAGADLKVLEVGCSTGYLGSALKQVGHTVWGIEPSSVPASVAREKLDFVYEGFVEDFIDAYQDERFDVIIFGDVLEHLTDTQAVLKRCHDLLTPIGAVIASIPNVSHLAVRAMTFQGDWEYAELGILDKTHLRFFTRESMQQLFYQSDYVVCDIKPVTLPVEVLVDRYEMKLHSDVVDLIDGYTDDDTKQDFQYILMAVPAHAEKTQDNLNKLQPKIKVLGLANDKFSSHAEVRMMGPLKAWAAYCNGEVKFENFIDFKQELLDWCDILVIQRCINEEILDIAEMASRQGKKIIYESDDYMTALPAHLSHHQENQPIFKTFMKKMMRLTDCVTASTFRLVHHQFRPYKRPAVVIPNAYIEDGTEPAKQTDWVSNKATLIVASSDTVLVDFIFPAINQIINNDALDVSVVVIGPPGDAFDAAGISCQRVKNMVYPEFKAFLKTVDNPIGLIPLDGSTFSACKTAVKYFDYSMSGLPVVCSNVPPYRDVITDGEHALLADNETEAWASSIEKLVSSVNLRQSLVAASQTLIREDYNALTVIQAWDMLLKDLHKDRYAFNPPDFCIIEERDKLRVEAHELRVLAHHLREETHVLREEGHQARVMAHEFRESLESMTKSLSWRITKPLRYILRKFSKE